MRFRQLLYVTVVVIIFSPLVYFSTGIGQGAGQLSQTVIINAQGEMQTSPKAEALHTLRLPLRIQRLLIFPLFLFLLQYTGLAVRLRVWLQKQVVSPLSQRKGVAMLTRICLKLSRNHLTFSNIILIVSYIALITLLLNFLLLPLSFYSSFVLGQQFGLSTQTIGGWLRDWGLTLMIELVLTIIVYGGFYGITKIMPRQWPLWGGLGFTVLTLGYVLLEPIIITPLFYQISPLTDPDLQSRITEMAARAEVVIDDVVIIDASSKTTAVNAYVTGFLGANKIVIWDTLLLNHTPDEVDVVLAHEMGHWVYQHVLLSLLAASAGGWLGLFALRYWLKRVWQGLGWTDPYDVAGYPYLLGLIALVTILTLPIYTGFSRLGEGQADTFALTVSQKPDAAIGLFKGLAEQNIAPLHVSPWEKYIFYTHPPLSERIDKAQMWLQNE